MAVLDIITEPDPRYAEISPRLRQKSEPVTEIDDDIVQFARDMHETMQAAHGIGLAAPQVGLLKRLVVLHIPEGYGESDQPEHIMTLINPEILKAGGQECDYEGCLSFPDLIGEVLRYGWVNVRAYDINGERVRFRARGPLARAIQHEIDHLDGILFFDRMENSAQLHYVAPAEEDESNPVTA